MSTKPKVKKPVVVAPKPKPARTFVKENFVRSSEAAAIDPNAKPVSRGSIETLRGMRDILPDEQKYFINIVRKGESMAHAHGFEKIETPLVENTNLFTRTAGKTSDVVEKEMYTFLDKGNDSVTLRPEGTASMARAYINHGMLNLPQPVKLYYHGPMFRYDRPQHGRYRQHFQFGMESFGDANPIVDAELIYLSVIFCKQNGIAAMVKINSIGCSTCRAAYIAKLLEYYKTKRTHLCEDCKRRLVKNPLRLLDCKVVTCAPFKIEAPVFLDHLDEDCKKHIMRVLEILDDLEVAYDIDNNLVRGFDYYNRTVFELFSNDGDSVVALGGGGRYDGLVEQLGGRPTPACGFGLGIDRLAMTMRERGVVMARPDAPVVFLAQLGDPARKKAFILFEELRNAGVVASANFSKSAIKAQLEIANRLGVKYTLILGQQEVVDGTVLVRDMESGMQETVDIGKVVYEVKKKLGLVA